MHRRAARTAAAVACLLGLTHAAFSAYWALGGTWLLDTIGGDLETWLRPREPLVLLGLWMIVLLKAGVAVAAPVLQYDVLKAPRLARILSWIAAGFLTLYGAVLTAAGLIAAATGVDADNPRALAWHAYFWDPWFLLWGLAFLLSLHWSRRGR